MQNPFLPFTIDQLLVHTFAPHDGSLVVSKDGEELLGMTPAGTLEVIFPPEGMNFNTMSGTQYDRFVENWTQILHVI